MSATTGSGNGIKRVREPSGRLWSLLEMLKFDGSTFHHVVGLMASTIALVDSDKDSSGEKHKQRVIAETRVAMRERLEELRSCFVALGARYADKAAARMLKDVASGDITYEEAAKHYYDIDSRLYDELADCRLFVLPTDKAVYFEAASTLFGEEVAAIFPLAAYDIDEAGKCFALGRCTAAIFHLMRIVEIGIRELCETLNVAVSPNAGWLVILNEKLEPAINKLPEGTPTEKRRKTDLQQARAHLHAIRLGWRNDTMHPKATYTEEEARGLIAHVETFMRHLATRLSAGASEGGLPRA